MNSNGTARDVFVFPVLALGLFLFLIFGTLVANTLFDAFLGQDVINDTPEAVTILQDGKSIFNRLDWISIAFLIATFILFIATSWFVAGHPILVGIYFIAGVVSVFFSAMISNFWEDITVTSQLLSTVAVYPITNHLMLNLPIYLAIMWFVGLIITFRKPQEGQIEF